LIPFDKLTKKERQRIFLDCYRRALNDADALQLLPANCRIRASSVSKWKNDPEFLRQYKEIEIGIREMIVSAFRKKISEGDTAAIIYGMKTIGKKIGLSEKIEIEATRTIRVEDLKFLSLDAAIESEAEDPDEFDEYEEES